MKHPAVFLSCFFASVIVFQVSLPSADVGLTGDGRCCSGRPSGGGGRPVPPLPRAWSHATEGLLQDTGAGGDGELLRLGVQRHIFAPPNPQEPRPRCSHHRQSAWWWFVTSPYPMLSYLTLPYLKLYLNLPYRTLLCLALTYLKLILS